MSWVMRRNASWLPIRLHVALAVAVGALGGWWLGAALFAGMMSHVVQGAIINYFGHAHGGRNFATDDDSRNNHFAAWLVLGEGFQNNHHRWPSSARFSFQRHEVDMGWAACLVLERLGMLTINRRTVLARVSAAPVLEPVPTA
jgi:stearoyl-CoA desaturase (delta-9 desaturase)